MSIKNHHHRCGAAGGRVGHHGFLVLSGKGRISPTTVEKVNQAIEQLGYVRNRQAATLRGGESGVIGLILRDICEPFYAEMTAGLSEALEAHDKLLF